jgi:outer membrane murein-binding lipoprotein Lpp
MMKRSAVAIGISLALSGSVAAQAQDKSSEVQELKARIERLEELLRAGGSKAPQSSEAAPPAASAAAPARPSVALNGNANVELDTTHQTDSGSTQDGRVELNLLGKTTFGDAFVAGKATFLARKDGSTDVDDMWVQAGNSTADLKLGRFEAADLFPQGRDTVLNRAGSGVYRANFIRGRFGGSSGNVVHLAGFTKLGSGLGLEIGLADTGDAENLSAGQAEGLRPVLTYTANGIAVKAGFEFGRTIDDTTGKAEFTQTRGFGLTAGAAIGPGIANLNLAAGKVDGLWKAATIAANYTIPLGPWVHFEYGRLDPEVPGLPTETVRTFGVGYQFSLLGIKDAFITPAFSYSSASSPNDFAGLGGSGRDSERAVRVRFNYTFAAF